MLQRYRVLKIRVCDQNKIYWLRTKYTRPSREPKILEYKKQIKKLDPLIIP